MILISLTVLISGCARTIDGDYCDLAGIKHFESVETIHWLNENDQRLLVQIVTENEVYQGMCP